MARNPSTTTAGGHFNAAVVEAVWQKGQVVSGYDPTQWRQDSCGAWMSRREYGNTSKFGWEIDHIRPVAHGGGDDLSNLQPLYWEHNRNKADNYPHWQCKVRAA